LKNKRKYLCLILAALLWLPACKTHKNTTAEDQSKTLTQKEKLQNTSLLIDGMKEKMLGNYEKAITSFTKCMSADPHNSTAMYELASVYVLQSNYNEALPFAKKAIAEDKENIWYRLLLADIYEKSKKLKESIDVYNDLVKKYPDNIEYYFDLALANIMAGKYIDAIDVYDKVEKKIGVTEEISLQKEKIYTYINKPAKSILEIQKLIDKFPSETKYYSYLAQLYMNNKMPEKAFDVFNKIIEIEPNNAGVHLALADYYRDKKDKNNFFKEIKLAFSNENLDIDTKVKILLSYYDLTNSGENADMKEQAMDLTKILVQTHPGEAKAYAISGDFFYREKRYTEAREQFKKAIAIDSSKYAIWEQLLYIDAALDDFPSMEKESKKVMDIFPEQPLPYLFNGNANIQLKNYDQAISSLKEGIKIIVENNKLLEEFYSYLGDAAYKAGRNDESDDAYEKVLQLDPSNKYVLNNYSYYLSLRKVNLEKAQKMGKKAVELEPFNSSYLDTYAWALYQDGKYNEAKIQIDKAIENGGDKNAVILEHCGDILYKAGETGKALEYWQKAKNAGKGSAFLDKKISDKKLYE